VKLIAPQLVKPYLKRGKNDAPTPRRFASDEPATMRFVR